jgi:hypothetical protein
MNNTSTAYGSPDWLDLKKKIIFWMYKAQWIFTLYDWCMGGSQQIFLILCWLSTNMAAIGSTCIVHCPYKPGERHDLESLLFNIRMTVVHSHVHSTL